LLQPRLLRSDGSIPVLEKSVPRSSDDFRLQTIIEHIKDPKASRSEILRLIQVEMGSVIQTMAENGAQPSKRFKVSLGLRQVRVLRNLAAEVRQTHKYRQKEDVLDLDGPKFTFVLGKIMECFQQGLRETLGPDSDATVQNVLRHLRDNFSAKEPEIRRELKRMG
jgi:hypothetical protein